MAHINTKLIVRFALVALTAAALIGCTKKQSQARQDPNSATPITTPQQPAESNKTPPAAAATVKPVAQTASDTKLTLNQIIARRVGWSPVFMNWYGKQAPDFTVTDINGQKHTLSDYKGKNVMIVFWATWCGPCIKEIPHLVQLRKDISEDRLAILGVSYIDMRNTPAAVQMFVKNNPFINYTIISVAPDALPNPYDLISGIPSGFYIDTQGRIKFATEGMISLQQMKAIIEAER